MARVIRSSGSWVTEEATYRLIATGGVIMPIASPTTMIRPKCTGSMPSWVTSGSNTGVRMIRALAVSMNTPVSRITATTSSRMT